MTSTVTVRHNFETGHRLPHLPGKCQSLHGHSWWAEVTVAGALVDGIVLDFGTLKRHLRDWIDTYLDHGLMLGGDDELLPLLEAHGKVYPFPEGEWPTVENVARLLHDVTQMILAGNQLPGTVVRVRVTETHVNAAEWVAP